MTGTIKHFRTGRTHLTCEPCVTSPGNLPPTWSREGVMSCSRYTRRVSAGAVCVSVSCGHVSVVAAGCGWWSARGVAPTGASVRPQEPSPTPQVRADPTANLLGALSTQQRSGEEYRCPHSWRIQRALICPGVGHEVLDVISGQPRPTRVW